MTTQLSALGSGSLEAAGTAAARLADRLAVPPPPGPGADRRPGSPRWRAQSLSKGAAGIAVLHGARARAGLTGWDRAHAWLACATREELSAGTGAGLWYGAPAIAFAVSAAAAPGTAQSARHQLDTAVRALTTTRLETARARINAGKRPALAEFDLVRGLTGLGAYLLHTDPHGTLARQVLGYLVRLTEPVPAGRARPPAPGWWTGDIPKTLPARAFAGGHADLGMAHGITGPLALMALAAMRGVTVDGQAAAIGRICAWLEAWRQDGPHGPWWPERVTLAELRDGTTRQRGPGRPSWCYGTPGVARALQLAGLALAGTTRQRMAEDALAACLADSAQAARITGPALCHGWAGLVLTAWRAAGDAATPVISGHLPRLIGTLTTASPAAAAGPGLIEGTAGIALTLHAIATRAGPGGWETCLLIS
jgi:lantibiotic biosynthesis protein